MNEVRAVDFPAFRTWSTKFVPEMPPVAYVQLETTLLSAMLVSELVFPRLIEVRGCVVRADKYDVQNFDDWWDHLSGDRGRVERIINFQPMRFFFDPADEVEERALDVLADRIARRWRIQAARRFPDRTVVVEVVEGHEDDGPTVLMYTHRPDA